MTELVIFDSDGVLVDSEHLALAVMAEAAMSEGAPMSAQDAVRLFRGLKIADCVVEIERRSGRRVRESFIEDVRHATALAFDDQLQAIDGVHAALDEIDVPVCVASNGPMSKLTHTLSLTKLLPRFEGRIFSAYEVGSWKPDPGLFLHAASTMKADPSRCLVVEDSPSGIRAAQAAGMRVLGFTNGIEELGAELSSLCSELFHHMRELPQLLKLRADLHGVSHRRP